jgi:Flp pilus assembly pilin Flp
MPELPLPTAIAIALLVSMIPVVIIAAVLYVVAAVVDLWQRRNAPETLERLRGSFPNALSGGRVRQTALAQFAVGGLELG